MSVLYRCCLLLAAWCAQAALPLARAMPLVSPGGVARDRSGERSFVVRSDAFWRDGQRVQVVSGELHYFRVPRAYWRDRMARMRSLGFNTIQTYVAWNFHEPVRGSIDWSGDRDVRRPSTVPVHRLRRNHNMHVDLAAKTSRHDSALLSTVCPLCAGTDDCKVALTTRSDAVPPAQPPPHTG
jgi:hypothetical protein